MADSMEVDISDKSNTTKCFSVFNLFACFIVELL